MVCAFGGEEVFAGEFRCAVDAERGGRVGLDVGLGAAMAEDVVGADLDDARTRFFAGCAEVLTCRAVAHECVLGFFFTKGDIVECGCIHDDIGLGLFDEFEYAIAIHDVDAIGVGFVDGFAIEGFAHIATQLSACADYEYIHELAFPWYEGEIAIAVRDIGRVVFVFIGNDGGGDGPLDSDFGIFVGEGPFVFG